MEESEFAAEVKRYNTETKYWIFSSSRISYIKPLIKVLNSI